MTVSAPVRANPVTFALEAIADRWVLMLLQQALFGVCRFDEFQRRLQLARGTLASRLQHLIRHDLLCRRPAEPGGKRQVYVLTAKGADLFEAALMLERWQREWAPPSGARPVLQHRVCGCRTSPRLVCACCRQEILPQQVSYQDGPGAGWVQRVEPRRRRSSVPAAVPPRVPVAEEVLQLLGDRWTPQVAAAAFFGVRRFHDFRRSLGLASNILADRLQRLVALGIFRTEPYQQSPLREHYRLTERGLALYPFVLALLEWGNRWYAPATGAPLELTHRACGARLVPLLVCDQCGGVINRAGLQLGFERARASAACGMPCTA